MAFLWILISVSNDSTQLKKFLVKFSMKTKWAKLFPTLQNGTVHQYCQNANERKKMHPFAFAVWSTPWTCYAVLYAWQLRLVTFCSSLPPHQCHISHFAKTPMLKHFARDSQGLECKIAWSRHQLLGLMKSGQSLSSPQLRNTEVVPIEFLEPACRVVGFASLQSILGYSYRSFASTTSWPRYADELSSYWYILFHGHKRWCFQSFQWVHKIFTE